MKCPCIGCVPPKRKMFCHSHCDEYDAWCEQRIKEKKKLEDDYAWNQSEAAKRQIWRSLRRR